MCLLIILSIIPYLIAMYVYKNLYFWTWFQSDLIGLVLIAIIFWLISCLPVLFEWMDTDFTPWLILVLLSSLFNGCVLIQHAGRWALARIVTEEGIQLLPFIKMIGPLILPVIYIFIVFSVPEPDKDNNGLAIIEEKEERMLTWIPWKISMYFGTGVVLCLFNTLPETIKAGGVSINFIPGLLGYKYDLPFLMSKPKTITWEFPPGVVQPTWTNIGEWTTRLKVIAILALVFMLISVLMVVIRSKIYGGFFRKVFSLFTATVEYFFILYVFLYFRREVLMNYDLWSILGEALFAVIQMAIALPFIYFPIASIGNGLVGESAPEAAGNDMDFAMEGYKAARAQYDIASLPDTIRYQGKAYYLLHGSNPRVYRSYDGEEISIRNCCIHGDSALTDIGTIMLY